MHAILVLRDVNNRHRRHVALAAVTQMEPTLNVKDMGIDAKFESSIDEKETEKTQHTSLSISQFLFHRKWDM